MRTTETGEAPACELCGRRGAPLTRHHLIPRTRHRDARVRRRYSRAELAQRVAWLCRACHKQVHAVLDEKTLARDYDSVDKLRAHPELARFIRWIRRRPPGYVPVTRRRR